MMCNSLPVNLGHVIIPLPLMLINFVDQTNTNYLS